MSSCRLRQYRRHTDTGASKSNYYHQLVCFCFNCWAMLAKSDALLAMSAVLCSILEIFSPRWPSRSCVSPNFDWRLDDWPWRVAEARCGGAEERDPDARLLLLPNRSSLASASEPVVPPVELHD
jgi:hypothetical protein